MALDGRVFAQSDISGRDLDFRFSDFSGIFGVEAADGSVVSIMDRITRPTSVITMLKHPPIRITIGPWTDAG
jgi:hypothetical protein